MYTAAVEAAKKGGLFSPELNVVSKEHPQRIVTFQQCTHKKEIFLLFFEFYNKRDTETA